MLELKIIKFRLDICCNNFPDQKENNAIPQHANFLVKIVFFAKATICFLGKCHAKIMPFFAQFDEASMPHKWHAQQRNKIEVT